MTSSEITVVNASGTLPEKYSAPATKHAKKLFLIVPLVISLGLLWFAYSQWSSHAPVKNEQKKDETTEKKRIWWLPDLMKTLPPFANGYRLDKHSDRYDISSCSINGNFPEINAAVFCYLFNPERYTTANKTISTDLKGDGLCGNEPPLTLFAFDHWQKFTKPTTKKIAIVQEPLERFARQFRRICEIDKRCYDCNNDVICLMTKVFKEHERVAEGLDGDIRTYVTNHFSPQSWNCHFNFEYSKFEIVKIGSTDSQKSSFAGEMRRILSQQGVEQEKLSVITSEIMKIPLALSPDETRIAKAIRSDAEKWKIFRYLYEHDYIIFGFPVQ